MEKVQVGRKKKTKTKQNIFYFLFWSPCLFTLYLKIVMAKY